LLVAASSHLLDCSIPLYALISLKTTLDTLTTRMSSNDRNDDACYVESESEQQFYDIEHEKIVALLSNSSKDKQWKYNFNQNDVSIYTRTMNVDGTSFLATLGIGLLPLTTEAALILFNDLTSKHHWDESFDQGQIIAKIDEFTNITYAQYKAQFPTTARDLLYRTRVDYINEDQVNQNTEISASSFSIQHVSVPEKPNFIRSELVFAGIRLQPVAEDPLSCKCTYIVASNPKGNLPQFVVNTAATKQPLIIATIRKFVKENPSIKAHVQRLAAEAKIKRITNRNLQAKNSENNSINGKNRPLNDKESSNDNNSKKLTNLDNTNFSKQLNSVQPNSPSNSISPIDTADSNKSENKLDAAETSTAAALSSSAVDLYYTRPPAGFSASDIVLPPSSYDSLLERCYAESVRAVLVEKESDGWQFHSRQQEIDIYTKTVTGSSTNGCKGIGVINFPPDLVAAMFSDNDYHKLWDEMQNTAKDIEKVDLCSGISYASFKSPFPVTPRDLCCVGRSLKLLDNSIFMYSCSLETNLCPPARGHIRMTLHYCALLIRPVEEGRGSKITYALLSDPNGSIPKWLVNAASVKQPLCIAALSKLLSDPNSAPIIKEMVKRNEIAEAEKQEYIRKEQQKVIVQYLAQQKNNREISAEKSEGDSNNSAAINTGSAPATESSSNNSVEPPVDNPASTSSSSSISAEEFSVDAASGLQLAVPGMPASPYDPILLDTAAEAVRNLRAEGEQEGWQFHSRQQEVDIYIKKVAGSSTDCCKGVGIIPAAPEIVSCAFNDQSLRPEWDKMMASAKLIEQFDPYTAASYSAFAAPFPVSGRDFCNLGRKSIPQPDGSFLSYSRSIQHKNCPAVKGFVRGTLHFSGLLITPVEGGRASKVIYTLGSDPNGSIPKFLVNAANVAQPLCIATIRNFLQRPGILEKFQNKIIAQKETLESFKQQNKAGNSAPSQLPGRTPLISAGSPAKTAPTTLSLSLPAELDPMVRAAVSEAAVSPLKTALLAQSSPFFGDETVRGYIKPASFAQLLTILGLFLTLCKEFGLNLLRTSKSKLDYSNVSPILGGLAWFQLLAVAPVDPRRFDLKTCRLIIQFNHTQRLEITGKVNSEGFFTTCLQFSLPIIHPAAPIIIQVYGEQGGNGAEAPLINETQFFLRDLGPIKPSESRVSWFPAFPAVTAAINHFSISPSNFIQGICLHSIVISSSLQLAAAHFNLNNPSAPILSENRAILYQENSRSFEPAIFNRNAARLVNNCGPLLSNLVAISSIVGLQNPYKALFFALISGYCLWNFKLLPIALSAYIVYYLLGNLAQNYFTLAKMGSESWWNQYNAQQQQVQGLQEFISSQSKEFNPATRNVLAQIQTLMGELAAWCESWRGSVDWSNGEQAARLTGFAAIIGISWSAVVIVEESVPALCWLTLIVSCLIYSSPLMQFSLFLLARAFECARFFLLRNSSA
jgi:hypothetical protein